MPLLTRQILTDLGVHIDDASYAMLAEHFDSTLQERVIEEIITELSVEQAEELATLRDQNDDQALLAWLSTNVPDFAEIVTDEVDILLGEIAQDSEKF